MQFQPWDIVFSVPDKKPLQFMKIKPKLKLEKQRMIKLFKRCYGVHIADEKIYVTLHHMPGYGDIKVLNLNNDTIISIDKFMYIDDTFSLV